MKAGKMSLERQILKTSQPPLSPVQGSGGWKVKDWGVELRLEIKYTIDVYVNKENVKLRYWHCVWFLCSWWSHVYISTRDLWSKGQAAPRILMRCLPCKHCLTAPSFHLCTASVPIYYCPPPQGFQPATFKKIICNGEVCKEGMPPTPTHIHIHIPPLLPKPYSGEDMLCLMTSGNQAKHTVTCFVLIFREVPVI